MHEYAEATTMTAGARHGQGVGKQYSLESKASRSTSRARSRSAPSHQRLTRNTHATSSLLSTARIKRGQSSLGLSRPSFQPQHRHLTTNFSSSSAPPSQSPSSTPTCPPSAPSLDQLAPSSPFQPSSLPPHCPIQASRRPFATRRISAPVGTASSTKGSFDEELGERRCLLRRGWSWAKRWREPVGREGGGARCWRKGTGMRWPKGLGGRRGGWKMVGGR